MTKYHLGDLLSYTTGRLTAPDKMTGVRRLAEGVTGEPMTEIGLLKTSNVIEMHLVAHHPWLLEISAPDFTEPGQVMPWLDRQVERYGEWHEVPALPR